MDGERRSDNLALLEAVNESVKSVNNLNEKFSIFLASDSARCEREKHDRNDIDALKLFKEDYEKNDKPVIDRARKFQSWFDNLVGKAVVFLIVGILVVTGIVYIPSKFVTPTSVEQIKK